MLWTLYLLLCLDFLEIFGTHFGFTFAWNLFLLLKKIDILIKFLGLSITSSQWINKFIFFLFVMRMVYMLLLLFSLGYGIFLIFIFSSLRCLFLFSQIFLIFAIGVIINLVAAFFWIFHTFQPVFLTPTYNQRNVITFEIFCVV